MTTLTNTTNWNPEMDKMVIYMRDKYDLCVKDMGINNDMTPTEAIKRMEEVDTKMKAFYKSLNQ